MASERPSGPSDSSTPDTSSFFTTVPLADEPESATYASMPSRGSMLSRKSSASSTSLLLPSSSSHFDHTRGLLAGAPNDLRLGQNPPEGSVAVPMMAELSSDSPFPTHFSPLNTPMQSARTTPLSTPSHTPPQALGAYNFERRASLSSLAESPCISPARNKRRRSSGFGAWISGALPTGLQVRRGSPLMPLLEHMGNGGVERKEDRNYKRVPTKTGMDDEWGAEVYPTPSMSRDCSCTPSPPPERTSLRSPGTEDSESSTTKETPTSTEQAQKKLKLAIALCSGFFVIELIGGLLAGSLAILSDSFHLLTDLTGMAISMLSMHLSHRSTISKGTSSQHTRYPFGYARAEVLGALFSVLLIWVMTILVVIEAIRTMVTGRSEHVEGGVMLVVAAGGVLMNVGMLMVLGMDHGCGHSHGHSHNHAHHGCYGEHGKHHNDSHQHDDEKSCNHSAEMRKPHNLLGHLLRKVTRAVQSFTTSDNLNVRAALIHVIGDLLFSFSVLATSLVIHFYPWLHLLDPGCALLFSTIILWTSRGVARDSVRMLMEGTPSHINVPTLHKALKNVKGVVTVLDLKIWALNESNVSMTARVLVGNDVGWDWCNWIVKECKVMARNQGVNNATFQVEFVENGGMRSR